MAAKKRIVKKVKKKDWYNILAPAMYNEVFIAETMASNPKDLIGRQLEASVGDIINDFKKKNMKLKIIVDSVKDNNAKTSVKRYELSKSFLSKITRRKLSKIDCILDAELKDGSKARIKSFAMCPFRTNTSKKKLVREELRKNLIADAKNLDKQGIINAVSDKKFQIKISKTINKTYPVKSVEVRMIQF